MSAAIAALATKGAPSYATTPAKPYALVMNSGEASVSVIDIANRTLLRTLPTLREPSHWALSPDRSKLYVADASGNALFVIDPATGEPLGHKTIADPYQLGYTPDQRYLMVNALRLDQTDIYRANDLTLVKRFGPGSMPSHLDFSPDSRFAFASMQGSDTLVSFDLSDMTIRWKSKFGKTPAGVLWLNDKVLCCAMGEDFVAECDPADGRVLRRIRTGPGAHNLFLTPDRKTLYVSNRVAGSLADLDPITMQVRRIYPLKGTGPDDMGVAPDGKLWISLRFRGQVAVLDPKTGEFETINVGRSPHGIFLSTQMNRPGPLTAQLL